MDTNISYILIEKKRKGKQYYKLYIIADDQLNKVTKI